MIFQASIGLVSLSMDVCVFVLLIFGYVQRNKRISAWRKKKKEVNKEYLVDIKADSN